MLKRAENVEAFCRRDLWGLLAGQYRLVVQVGRKEHPQPGRVTPDNFRAMKERSQLEPVRFGQVGERAYWRHADRWFWDNEGLTAQDVLALLASRELRRQDTVNRAHALAATTHSSVPGQRRTIPADVKQLVWHRDGGQCTACGSTSELQYDHVIPHSRGGADTEHNLQLLCGPCNRRKGASVS